MAETQTQEIPAEAPPSSVSPTVKTLSASQLQQELAPSTSTPPPPKGEMKAERVPPSSEKASAETPATKTRQIFKDESSGDNITLGDDKGNRITEKTMPDFAEAARKKLEEKRKAAESESKTPDTKTPANEQKKAPSEPAPKVASENDVPEDQRQVLPHDKPDTAKRIKFFLSETKRLAEEAAAAKKEIEELKKQPKTEANAEEIARLREEHQKVKEEAMRFRRRYEIEKDPEFNSKYIAPINEVDDAIISTFKRYKLTDASLKAIADEGGFAEFSRSQRTFPVTVPDPEGEGGTITIQKTAAELAHQWLNSMAVADAEAVKTAIGKQQLLKSEYHNAIRREQDAAKEYYEKDEASRNAERIKHEETIRKSTEEYTTWLQKTEAETEFLKDKPIPQDATPDQRKAIEDYNTFNKQLRNSLSNHPENAIQYGQLKLDAAEAHHLRRVLGEKDSEIASLREQLTKAKGALKTTGRSGSLLTGSNQKPEESSQTDDPTDFRGAFRKGAQKIQSGIED